MKKYLTCALMLVLFAAMACSEPVTVEMVVGEYAANHELATDTVEVRSDGTYRHYYKAPGGEEFINEDRWELEIVEGKSAVIFSDFESKWRKRQRDESRGYYPAFVERSFFSGIRLSISYDLGYYYIKTDPQENRQ